MLQMRRIVVFVEITAAAAARGAVGRTRRTRAVREVVMVMVRCRGRAVSEWWRDALLLLPSIAEPNAHDLLLELELIG